MYQQEQSQRVPMLALRGISAFPNMLLNFDVERSISVSALDAAMDADRNIFLLAQRDVHVEEPDAEDLYIVGTLCFIKQILRMPNGGVRVMVEGKQRAKLLNVISKTPFFDVEVALFSGNNIRYSQDRAEAVARQTHALLESYGELSTSVSPEFFGTVLTIENPGFIADYIAQNIYMKHNKKQIILDEVHPLKRLEKLNNLLIGEIEILEIENQLKKKTNDRLMRNQREHFLREQMRTIQNELGVMDSNGENYTEFDEYRDRILRLHAPDEVTEKLLKELQKLSKQPYASSEASLIRAYLDTCIELPWNHTTKERADIVETRKILDADHYGLEKVKQRIIEFVAVRQFAPETKGGILCLIGPPGTGKTSIGMSVAKALNRKMARISLGGVHDEAEIRGHRKTYVGAMPGRIMAAVAQSGSRNPLLLLDEIDKLGHDYRGDPAAALLEALDPEQNSTFRDHYIELPFDLSETIFITTANNRATIPRPLLDRMEIIELTSYTDEEKVMIAKNHLVPKQRKKHGLKSRQLKLSDSTIRAIITGYTRESGVRTLERELATVCRRCALKFLEEDKKSITVTSQMLEELLGVKKYKNEFMRKNDEIGLVKGLAWTSVGGEILDVEVNVMDGSGKLEMTGNLGDVMKESARAGISYIRSRAKQLNIDPEFYKNKDIHIHFPEGATPKDGPSAGITVTLAVISALTGLPVRRDIAMTGEITLRGRILPIGGLKEKTMAALRNGINTVIIPQENESDLEEIDPIVRNALTFVVTDHIDKILDFAMSLTSQQIKKNDISLDIPPIIDEIEKVEDNRSILH